MVALISLRFRRLRRPALQPLGLDPAFGPGEIRRPHQDHNQVDRDDLERQQVARHAAFSTGFGCSGRSTRTPISPIPSRVAVGATAAWAWPRSGADHSGTLSAACNSTTSSEPPTISAMIHCPPPVFIETNGPRAVSITPNTKSTIVPPT